VAVAWSSSRGACSGEAEEKARERGRYGGGRGAARMVKKERMTNGPRGWFVGMEERHKG
jgi:hypothetical protein